MIFVKDSEAMPRSALHLSEAAGVDNSLENGVRVQMELRGAPAFERRKALRL